MAPCSAWPWNSISRRMWSGPYSKGSSRRHPPSSNPWLFGTVDNLVVKFRHERNIISAGGSEDGGATWAKAWNGNGSTGIPVGCFSSIGWNGTNPRVVLKDDYRWIGLCDTAPSDINHLDHIDSDGPTEYQWVKIEKL